jgi:DNA-binding NtrC family response regulator
MIGAGVLHAAVRARRGGTTLAPSPGRTGLPANPARDLLPLDVMAHLWIVHRDARWREALRQLAGGVPLVAGDPTDARGFDEEVPPRAVLLGVAGDFEAELEFVHRHAPRLEGATWVLLARERDRAEVERLFDALPIEVIALGSNALVLRRRIAAALARRPAAALTARSRRDVLARRFALWTADLDASALLPAADPTRAHVPLVVRGEPGTGRGLVARYLAQATKRDPREGFVALRGGPGVDLAAELASAAGSASLSAGLTICVEEADQLDPAGQAALRDWIEHAPPSGVVRAARVRWMATAGPDADDALDPALADALAGHAIELPPLRDRPRAIEALIAATGRTFTAEALAHLRAHPWPGNLRELDAVLRRTIAARSTDPIGPDDLQFDLAPLELEVQDERKRPLEAPAPTAPRQGVSTEAPVPTAPGEPAPTEEPAREGALGAFARSEPKASEVEKDASEPATGRAEGPTAAPLTRLTSAIAHEVGNPLVGIRTYASMLPTRFDDPEFRAQFSERVESDTRRIETVLETLAQLGGFGAPARAPVDVSALLAAALERERPRIRERRLVVLEELDRMRPHALGDAAQLGFALGLVIESALAWIPPRGDLYVATRHRPPAAGRGASLRIELRMRGAGEGLGFGEQTLAVSVAETVVRAHGGSLASERGAGSDGLVIELPAP